MNAKDNAWFSVNNETDSITFSTEGRRELAPLFASAGIDIESIKSYQRYLEARRMASPFFMSHLKAIAEGDGSDAHKLERRALVALINDDPGYARLKRQLDTREQLKVID